MGRGGKKSEPLLSDDDEIEFDDAVMNEPDVELSESESESDSEEDSIIKLAEPSKTFIFNRDVLVEKLHDISWPENVDWIHRLTVDVDQGQAVDVNDDLAREVAFYNQALEGTRIAFDKLQSMGLPFLRPSDYYAEMVKSDSHMIKVKARLLSEKRNIEEAEERRKARESKRLAKEIQAEKLKERAKNKKEEIEAVKKWRKQRQKSGFAGGDNGAELDFSFEEGKTFQRSSKKRQGVAPGDRSGGRGGEMGKKKREFRDTKFGYGGKKRLKKQNSADTTSDIRGFNKDSVPGNKKRKMK